MPDQFAQEARSLVGKTRGAQKRMLAAEAWRQLDKHPYLAGVRGGSSDEQAAAMYRRWVARAIRSYLLFSDHLGKRLKPCPGCTGCSIWTLREKKPQQFIGRWVPKTQEDRDDPAFLEQILQLLDLVNACSPQDQRTSLDSICDGSGTLPAGKKIPR